MCAEREAREAICCSTRQCLRHPASSLEAALAGGFASVAEEKCATHGLLSIQKHSINTEAHAVPPVWCAAALVPDTSTPSGRSYSDEVADVADRAVFRPPLADFAAAMRALPTSTVEGGGERDSGVGEEHASGLPVAEPDAREDGMTTQGERGVPPSATDSHGSAASCPLSSDGDDDIDRAFGWPLPQIEDLSSDAVWSQEGSSLSPVSLHPQSDGTSASGLEPTGHRQNAVDAERWMARLAGETEVYRVRDPSHGSQNDAATALAGDPGAAPRGGLRNRSQDIVTSSISEAEEEPPWMTHLRYCSHCAAAVAERGQGQRAMARVPPTHGPHTPSSNDNVKSTEHTGGGAQAPAAIPATFEKDGRSAPA